MDIAKTLLEAERRIDMLERASRQVTSSTDDEFIPVIEAAAKVFTPAGGAAYSGYTADLPANNIWFPQAFSTTFSFTAGASGKFIVFLKGGGGFPNTITNASRIHILDLGYGYTATAPDGDVTTVLPDDSKTLSIGVLTDATPYVAINSITMVATGVGGFVEEVEPYSEVTKFRIYLRRTNTTGAPIREQNLGLLIILI